MAMLYEFNPADNISAETLAQVFKALTVRVDESVFSTFPPDVKEQFRELSEEELAELQRQRNEQVAAMRRAAEEQKSRIVVPDIIAR